jgi:hypothetical protein
MQCLFIIFDTSSASLPAQIHCHLPYPLSKPTIQVLLTTIYLGSQHGICIPIGHAINFAGHTRFLASGCLCVGFSGGRLGSLSRKNNSALQYFNTMTYRIKNWCSLGPADLQYPNQRQSP